MVTEIVRYSNFLGYNNIIIISISNRTYLSAIKEYVIVLVTSRIIARGKAYCNLTVMRTVIL